jgi:hypothetical protein
MLNVKKKKLLSVIVMILCITLTMSGCSVWETLQTNSYNEGENKDFVKIELDEVCFDIPADTKGLTYNVYDVAPPEHEAVYEEQKGDRYQLIHYPELILAVSPITLQKDLREIDDRDKLKKELKKNNIDIADIKLTSTYTSVSIRNNDKVISGAKGTCTISDITYDYKGHATVIENGKGNSYIMIALTTDKGNKDTKHMVKSFKFSDKKTTATEKISSSEISTEEVSNKLDGFMFTLNGENVTLPINTQEFITKLDLEMDNLDTVINSKEMIFTHVKKGDYGFMVGIYNPTSTKKTIKESEVYCIKVNCVDVKALDGKLLFDFILPNDVRPFMVNDNDLVNEYGKPTEDKDMEEYFSRILNWKLPTNKNDNISGFEVTIDTEVNVVCNFTYTHFPYKP